MTHMEQPVYLAIWKDLNKKKRKEHRKKTVLEINEQGKEIDRLRVAVAGIIELYSQIILELKNGLDCFRCRKR